MLRKKDQIFGGGLQTDRVFTNCSDHRLRFSAIGLRADSLPFSRTTLAYHRLIDRDGVFLGYGPSLVPAEEAVRAQCAYLYSDYNGDASHKSFGDSLPLRAEWEQSNERHSLFSSSLLHFIMGCLNNSITYPIYQIDYFLFQALYFEGGPKTSSKCL